MSICHDVIGITSAVANVSVSVAEVVAKHISVTMRKTARRNFIADT